MKNKVKMSIYIIIGSVFLLLAITRSCFYSINQPLVRQTGKLVNKEKSSRYYYGYGFFKENIYYWRNLALGDGPEKLENVDKKTFTVLSERFAKDKNRVYSGSVGDKNVDAPTFEYVVSQKDEETGFGRDKNHVYSLYSYERGENSVFKIVPDANPATYQALENNWSKDDKNVYYRFVKVDADAQTFVNINYYYSKDKNYLYSQGLRDSIRKEKCNTSELSLIADNNLYIRTKTRIYFSCDDYFTSLPLKDTASIKNLYDGRWLNVDEKIVVDGTWLNSPDVDEKTFVSLGWGFFKDNKNVYFGKWKTPGNKNNLVIIADADLNTFEQIGGNYAKDKNHVYYRNEIISGVNPNNFSYDKESNYGYSGKNVYFLGEKTIK